MTVKGIKALWQIGSVPIYNTEDYRYPSFHPSFRRNHHHRHDPPCLFLQSFCSSCPSYLCSHSQTILPFFFPQVLYGGSSSEVVKHCPLCDHWSRTPGRRRLLRVQLLRHGRHCREVGGSSCQVSSQVHPNEGGLSKGKPISRLPTTTFRPNSRGQVYNKIAHKIDEAGDYDGMPCHVYSVCRCLTGFHLSDGSFGPVILRLAWHCSGTYDKETKTGGRYCNDLPRLLTGHI